MDADVPLELDIVIFGGGCAGLWLLDELRLRGIRALLLEANSLGIGQTANAQGILHGGLKYSLAGLLSSSARMVREMPAIWEEAIAGRHEPDLSPLRSRSPWCYLWRGQSLKSWTSMLAAVTALQVKPVALAETEVPPPLTNCPRPIYRLDERVIDPIDFLNVMARRNAGLIWKIDAAAGLEFDGTSSGKASAGCPAVRVRHPTTGQAVRLQPSAIVLAAGEGNAALREQLGLSGQAMQRRPLRVALVRGDLPKLNGHCVDGAKTRVTITSDVDSQARTVWQLGGQLTEDGVRMEPLAFARHARNELAAVLPGWQTGQVEWTSYLVDRAERSTSDGLMPGDVQILRDGAVLTTWPTKLVMAPLLSRRVNDLLQLAPPSSDISTRAAEWHSELGAQNWPAPEVARPAWEQEQTWLSNL